MTLGVVIITIKKDKTVYICFLTPHIENEYICLCIHLNRKQHRCLKNELLQAKLYYNC